MGQVPKIGQLKFRLLFSKDNKVNENDGSVTSTKSTDFELWGSVRQMSDSEVMRSGQNVSYINYEIYVLYQSDKLPNNRHVITLSNPLRTLTVKSVQEIEEGNRWIKIIAVTNSIG